MIVWYRFLATAVTGTALVRPLKMVLYDQALFSPVFLTSILLILRQMEGASVRQTLAAWRHDFVPVYTTGLQLWPAVQLVNFYLVPLNYRLLVVQSVSLGWNTYLSNKTQKSMKHLQVHDELQSPY